MVHLIPINKLYKTFLNNSNLLLIYEELINTTFYNLCYFPGYGLLLNV